MKGRGTRGMPGKGVKPPPGSGFNSASKKRMEKRDFERSEWTLVAEKDELGASTGSTKAVEAGQTPQGSTYIWNLVRGAEGSPEESTVYATDGSCRCCLFPLTKGTVDQLPDGSYALSCGLCGTQYSLDDGQVLDFCPKKNPVQVMAALANEKKGAQNINVLKTRISQAGRVYVRLPDGTLPIPQ